MIVRTVFLRRSLEDHEVKTINLSTCISTGNTQIWVDREEAHNVKVVDDARKIVTIRAVDAEALLRVMRMLEDTPQQSWDKRYLYQEEPESNILRILGE